MTTHPAAAKTAPWVRNTKSRHRPSGLRLCPPCDTVQSVVRLRSGNEWGCSSVGRALRSHRRGRGFDYPQLHSVEMFNSRFCRLAVHRYAKQGFRSFSWPLQIQSNPDILKHHSYSCHGRSIDWTHSISKQSHKQEPWYGARVNPRNNPGISKVVVSQRMLKIIRAKTV